MDTFGSDKTMFLEERQEKILELLAENGKVLVKELAEKFNVTEDSLRKDLGTLEQDGKLKRTYGGAVAIREKIHVAEANKRRMLDVEAKRKIAATAFKLIQPSDMIFMDISTINIALADLIARSNGEYKVVTNMIDVIDILSLNPKIDLLCVGGRINKSRDGFCGGITLELVSRLKPDIAFIGAVGVDVKSNSVSTYNIDEGVTKAKVIEVSKRAYIVAQSKKFSTDGNYNFSALDSISGIITDSKPKSEIIKAADNLGINIIYK